MGSFTAVLRGAGGHAPSAQHEKQSGRHQGHCCRNSSGAPIHYWAPQDEYLPLREEPQGKNFLLPGWDNGPNHLNITAAVGDLPIEARTKLCNGRGGLNMLEAGKLQRATNYAYDVRLDAPGNSQRFDTKNQPGCSDTINNPQQWREVDIMTGSGGNADNHRSGKTWSTARKWNETLLQLICCFERALTGFVTHNVLITIKYYHNETSYSFHCSSILFYVCMLPGPPGIQPLRSQINSRREMLL